MIADHAREQIGIVERALARAGKAQRAVPLTYIVWGLTGTLWNLLYIPSPWIAAHRDALMTLGDLFTVGALLVTGIEYWHATIDRRTTMDVQSLTIFGIVCNLLWILKFPLLGNGTIDGLAYAFLYSTGIATALLIHGAGPMRPLAYGGAFLFAAVIFAGMHPAYASLSFAIGNYCALVVPGVYLAFASRARG